MSSNYVESPVCNMVATNCACCGRPLVDAKSVEFGIGPICRGKYSMTEPDGELKLDLAQVLLDQLIEDHGFERTFGLDDRQNAVNKLAYWAACHQGEKMAAIVAQVIHALGYVKFAEKIADHAGAAPVTGTLSDDGLHVFVVAPYRSEALDAWRNIPGRRWMGNDQGNRIPVTSLPQVRDLVAKYYPDCTVDLPEVEVKEAEKPTPVYPPCTGRAFRGTRYDGQCACGEHVMPGNGWAFQSESRWKVACSDDCAAQSGITVNPPRVADELPSRITLSFARDFLSVHAPNTVWNNEGNKVLQPGGRTCRGCNGSGRWASGGRCAACHGSGQTRDRWVSPSKRVRSVHRRLSQD